MSKELIEIRNDVIVKKTERNDIMNSFFSDMSKNVNIKAIIVIEADSGLSKTKKVRLGYAGNLNGRDFKFEPSNYKIRTDHIQEKLFEPLIKKFNKFDKITSQDFGFDTSEDFIKQVFESINDENKKYEEDDE